MKYNIVKAGGKLLIVSQCSDNTMQQQWNDYEKWRRGVYSCDSERIFRTCRNWI